MAFISRASAAIKSMTSWSRQNSLNFCFHQEVWLQSDHYITHLNSYFCVSITKRCGWTDGAIRTAPGFPHSHWFVASRTMSTQLCAHLFFLSSESSFPYCQQIQRKTFQVVMSRTEHYNYFCSHSYPSQSIKQLLQIFRLSFLHRTTTNIAQP